MRDLARAILGVHGFGRDLFPDTVFLLLSRVCQLHVTKLAQVKHPERVLRAFSNVVSAKDEKAFIVHEGRVVASSIWAQGGKTKLIPVIIVIIWYPEFLHIVVALEVEGLERRVI